jgi:serralysin
MAEPVQVTPSTNPYLNALQWGGWRWDDNPNDSADKSGTVISYYFDSQPVDLNDIFGTDMFGVSRAWTVDEKAAYRVALDTWAAVANVTFQEVSSYNQADLVEHVWDNPDHTSPILLGFHETPEQASNSDGTAWGIYNGDPNHTGWTSNGLQVGGFGFITLVHELGHAVGLAHPHDHGGGSGLFPGVTEDDSADLGDNSLNQGVFTVMSYNDGWPAGPLGTSHQEGYGWEAGPMAFDIAAIQDLYGANMSYHANADTYILPDVNAAGTYYICIWDAGGTDEIVYNGVRMSAVSTHETDWVG